VRFTSPSSCPWLDRPVSGLLTATYSPYSDSLSLRLPSSVNLATESNSLTHYTKGTQSPPCGGSHCLYAYGFRFYFTPLTGVLFAFPSRYWFTIGRQLVFSLGGWSPHVQTGFHVSRPTRFHFIKLFVYRAITFYGHSFQSVLLNFIKLKGFSPFARRYLGNLN